VSFSGAIDGSDDRLLQMLDVIRNEVGQVGILGVVPNHLNGIEIWSIAGQSFHFQPRYVGFLEQAHGLAMRIVPIQDQDELAPQMAVVSRHWSGKHHAVVQGINLISLVWTDRESRLPCDFRLYNKVEDGLSKNDHFQHMIEQAKQRGFEPELVVFDSWYSGLPNLKLLRSLEWHWLTQLKSNREVSIDRSGNRAISEIFIPSQGCLVHLKGYGWIKVFRTVGTNGDAEYWATSRLGMTIEQAAFHALDAWQIEVYHRGLKQFTGVERGQYRLEISQRNHIGLAIRAFVRLEIHRLRTGISWFEAKKGIIRSAVRLYLAHPTITLGSTA